MGLWQAGFEVIGVDKEPQPNYPFQFIQADMLDLDPEWLAENADMVSIAPPCQHYSITASIHPDLERPALIANARELAIESGIPYFIENVEGAKRHLIDPITLCGSAVSLRVRRHRLIESNVKLVGLECDHGWQDYAPCYKVHASSEKPRTGKDYRITGVMPVFSHYQLVGGNDHYESSVAMGINWMTQEELGQAIPPAYGFHIGKQMMDYVMSGSNDHLIVNQTRSVLGKASAQTETVM
jgi:DNA (cytosine-5)-methyltransferase 1